MDQPGNGHFGLHMSQQTLNGRGGTSGHIGYEGNGHAGNGHSGNGHSGNGGYPGGGYAGYAAAPGAGQHHQQGYPDQQALVQQAQGGAETAADHGSAGPEGAAGAAGPEGAAEGAEAVAAAGEGAPAGDSAQDADTVNVPQGGAPLSSAADRMRELLARSTADHAASERATTTALDGIAQRLSGLERVVAELRDRAGTQPDVAARVGEQIAPQAQRLAGLSATLDGVSAGMSTVSTQLAAVDGRLTGIDTRLASNDAKHASTEGRVSALDTRFERLDERLDDQYDRVSSIDNRLAGTDSRVAALGALFAEALTPLAEEVRARPGRAEVEEMVTKVIESMHSDLATRLSSLEDTVLTLAEALLRPAPGHSPSALGG